MEKVIFAGGGMPLQKVLEAVIRLPTLKIVSVFTDLETDNDIVHLCAHVGITVSDIRLLKKNEATAKTLPPHDWFFSVNSTVLFSPIILSAPRKGALNMHPGRLPDYAGLHTHQWAIRNGETKFAATLHWMTSVVDAGPVVGMKTFSISPKETGLSLFLKSLSAGAALVIEALQNISANIPLAKIEQNLSLRHIYRDVDSRDGNIDWTQSSIAIERFVRAADYSPLICPTYKPTTQFRGKPIIVSKGEAYPEDLPGMPGTVVRIEKDGIIVRTGDGMGFKIRRCQTVEGKTYKENFDTFLHEKNVHSL